MHNVKEFEDQLVIYWKVGEAHFNNFIGWGFFIYTNLFSEVFFSVFNKVNKELFFFYLIILSKLIFSIWITFNFFKSKFS
jgi:hypothetical protein